MSGLRCWLAGAVLCGWVFIGEMGWVGGSLRAYSNEVDYLVRF